MKKFGYCLILIVAFFSGVIGTIVVYKNVPINYEIKETTIKDVNVTEINSLAESIDKVYNSVVYISTVVGRNSSSGTGFIYKIDDNYGYIITNNHVINGASKIEVTNSNDGVVDAELLGADEYADIAVLRIKKEYAISKAIIGESTDINVGDTIFAIGSPLGKMYMNSVSKGIISGKNRTITVEVSNGDFLMDVIQIDASINPGNSGGPLCNVSGEVIGVNSMKLVDSSVEGMGFAIPIEIVMPIVNQLEVGNKITRPYIGMQLLNISDTWKLYRYDIFPDNKITSGIAIVAIENDSPFYNIGLKKGTIITKINGIEIDSVAEFRYLLYREQIGNKVEITYINDNKTEKTSIVELK